MGKPNAYLAKQQAMNQKCFEAGCDITAQQFFDFLCIVLNDPDIMGKDVFGSKRLQKIQDALKEVDKKFNEAFVNSQESDYYQEKLDSELIRIFGKIDPFKKRYPFLKEWNYNKPCKRQEGNKMDIFDASEQAFVNGWECGFQAGMRSFGDPKMKAVVDVGAAIPTRAFSTDAGLDLCAEKSGWIFPKSRKVFGTGFHCAIPKGFVGMLTSKSGLMVKGITSRGTIDSGYTGEVKAVLFNHSWKFVRIKKWQKISQMVLMPIVTPKLEIVDSLEDTDRGEGGFGSTGL